MSMKNSIINKPWLINVICSYPELTHIPTFPLNYRDLRHLTRHTYLWFSSSHVCVMDTLIVDKMYKILQILSCDVLKFSEILTAFHSFMLAPPVFVLTRC